MECFSFIVSMCGTEYPCFNCLGNSEVKIKYCFCFCFLLSYSSALLLDSFSPIWKIMIPPLASPRQPSNSFDSVSLVPSPKYKLGQQGCWPAEACVLWLCVSIGWNWIPTQWLPLPSALSAALTRDFTDRLTSCPCPRAFCRLLSLRLKFFFPASSLNLHCLILKTHLLCRTF